MPGYDAAFSADTIDLNDFDLGEEPVFVDLDINTAGALTPDNKPSLDGALRIGEAEIRLFDVANIIGSGRGERLFGAERDGFILAGGGDDTVHPFNGDDVVDGGDGIDTLLLNAINGPLFVDLKRGLANTAEQSNVISNFENVTGSNLFSDSIHGDRNDNVLSGGAGGDDTLKGRSGDDVLLGGEGADRLHGGRGDDALDGGGGDDRLKGGRDDDTVTGGEGADRFVFTGRWGDDMLTDLNFGEGDTVKISGARVLRSNDDLTGYAQRLVDDASGDTDALIAGDDLVLTVGDASVEISGGAALLEDAFLI